MKRHNQYGYITGLVVAAICIVAAALLFLNRQHIIDQVIVWQYQPSSEIAALAERSGMSEQGMFYFYASQPELLEADEFNGRCERKEEATAILGCYNGQYIYIYNIDDERLDGIREVTAAHEMLHAVYERLGEDEKQRLGSLLEAEYAKLAQDKSWADRMEFYERTAPGERENELHSMIGTEVRNIGEELEAHYAKYFSERGKVVALYERYAEMFNSLQKRSEELSQQLEKLGDQIEQATIAYNADVKRLNGDIETFNDRATRGDFSSQSEFQSQRSDLLARASALESRRQAVDADIAQYTAMREELRNIASQSQALTRSLDSKLVPAPSL